MTFLIPRNPLCPRAAKAFNAYTSRFDASDSKINLKIHHTERVADVILELAAMLELPSDEQRAAYVCSLFHDIGRFEQIRKYCTFSDEKSENHATLSAKVIREKGLLDFLEEKGEGKHPRSH